MVTAQDEEQHPSSGSEIFTFSGGGGGCSSSSTQTTTTSRKKKEEEDPSSYTILIVDDEPDITSFYKSALEEEAGFKVDVFNDPLEALSKLKEIYSYYSSLNISSTATKRKPYDLMLLDIKMPKMNGFELYREIKKMVKKSQKEEEEQDIKICFITAYEVYYEQLKQEFPKIGNDVVGCFIKNQSMLVT